MNKVIWLLLALLIIFFLSILIIFTKLTIYVNYFNHNGNDDLKIEFRIWFGLIKFKKNIPLIKIDDNSPSIVINSNSQIGSSPTSKQGPDNKIKQITKDEIVANLKNMNELLHHVFNLHVIVKKFSNKVSIKQFEWHSMMGIGDAAHTGVLIGAIWAIKGSMLGMLSHYLKLIDMPKVTVTPQFQLAIIQTRLTCILQFRIGHAILAGIKLIKFWKGGLPHFKSKTKFSKEKTKSV